MGKGKGVNLENNLNLAPLILQLTVNKLGLKQFDQILITFL
jgi:hypothetical protein